MDDLERRYKIKQRRVYKEELSGVNKKIVKSSFLLGFSAIAFACGVLCTVIDPVWITSLIAIGLPAREACRCLIESLREKTILNYNIETLNSELGYNSEKDESVGRRR